MKLRPTALEQRFTLNEQPLEAELRIVGISELLGCGGAAQCRHLPRTSRWKAPEMCVAW